MRLTAFTDYTLRTLMYLAMQRNRLVTIADIAAAYGISASHLMKVVQQLAQAGDIATVRGHHGGLKLARPPESINLGAVVRRTELDTALVACFTGERQCILQDRCVLEQALRMALAAFMAALDRYTLADLVEPGRVLGPLLGVVVRANSNDPD